MSATIRQWRQDHLSSMVSKVHVTLCEAPRYLNLREQRRYDNTMVHIICKNVIVNEDEWDESDWYNAMAARSARLRSHWAT